MQATATTYDLQEHIGRMLTKHAADRMNTRRLPPAAISATIAYGRIVHIRGAEIHVIGRKEVERGERDGIDLSRYEGVQVVCGGDGTILTVYRNSNFRTLRPRHGRRRAYRWYR